MKELDNLQKLYDAAEINVGTSTEFVECCEALYDAFPAIVAHIADLEAQLGEARVVLGDLLEQVELFCEREGEADFETYNANKFLGLPVPFSTIEEALAARPETPAGTGEAAK